LGVLLRSVVLLQLVWGLRRSRGRPDGGGCSVLLALQHPHASQAGLPKLMESLRAL
jgi:hypothetical protein